MSSVSGWFEHDGIRFNAEIRCGGDLNHQGGFSQCLKVNSSKEDDYINGHMFFGDDKFEISYFSEGSVLVENKTKKIYYVDLSFPLMTREQKIDILEIPKKRNKIIIFHIDDPSDSEDSDEDQESGKPFCIRI